MPSRRGSGRTGSSPCQPAAWARALAPCHLVGASWLPGRSQLLCCQPPQWPPVRLPQQVLQTHVPPRQPAGLQAEQAAAPLLHPMVKRGAQTCQSTPAEGPAGLAELQPAALSHLLLGQVHPGARCRGAGRRAGSADPLAERPGRQAPWAGGAACWRPAVTVLQHWQRQLAAAQTQEPAQALAPVRWQRLPWAGRCLLRRQQAAPGLWCQQVWGRAPGQQAGLLPDLQATQAGSSAGAAEIGTASRTSRPSSTLAHLQRPCKAQAAPMRRSSAVLCRSPARDTGRRHGCSANDGHTCYRP